MSQTIAGMRQDPRVRQDALEQLLSIFDEVARRRRGTVVFLMGQAGSGRNATLRELVAALKQSPHHPHVIAGSMTSGVYTPIAEGKTAYAQTLATLGEAIALPAIFLDPLLGPVFGVVAQLLQAGAASWQTFKEMTRSATPRSLDVALLLKSALREAAAKRPTVCIIEGIDHAAAGFLSSFLHASALELTQQRPLLIVASADALPAEEDGAESEFAHAARSLARRGLARWLPLGPLSQSDIAAWLRDAEPDLVSHLHRITGGNPTWLALLWDDLWNHGKVRPHRETYRWELAPGYELAALGTVYDIFQARLARLLATDDPSEIEEALADLSCAALEGRTFTANAVAATRGWDTDEFVDFLDEALRLSEEQPSGLLEDLGMIEITTSVTTSHLLYRYGFVSELHWFTLDKYGLTAGERSALSLELAANLHDAYAP